MQRRRESLAQWPGDVPPFLKQAVSCADALDVSRRVGETWLWLLVATGCLGALAWIGLQDFSFNDYDNEARAAMTALVHGHFQQFVQMAPAYGGSLLERSPFAFAAALWGGGEAAVYRMLALPCLLALGAFAVWLAARMRRDGQGLAPALLALVLCTASPLVLLALEIGHPDEFLGGVLCVVAVLLAARGRGFWAGVTLGLAIANKEWAVLALGPVLMALPRRRVLCASIAGAVVLALFAPLTLLAPASSSGMASGLHAAATSAGQIFQPWQLWWFLGHATEHGRRLAPDWVTSIGHPLIVALGLPLTLLAWRRPTREHSWRRGQALLLLTLLLLERCMLDPWDNVYYPLPFILALLTWETLERRRPPLLALAATLAVWLGHRWLESISSPDVLAAAFAAWSLPLAAWLALRLYAPRALSPRRRPALLARPAEPLPLGAASAAAASRPA